MVTMMTKVSVVLGIITFFVVTKSFEWNDYQFFPTMMMMVKGRLTKVILLLDCMMVVGFVTLQLSRLFLGELRTAEEEKVYDKLYVTLIDTCLALTIFRGEVDGYIVSLFLLCTIIKVFHWLAVMRIHFLETQQIGGILKYVRLYILVIILGLVDLSFTYYYIQKLKLYGVNIRILFLTEYTILLCAIAGSMMRYTLFLYSLLLGREWSDRGGILFYIDIFCDVTQSLAYIGFFLLTVSRYGLPLHLAHEVYSTVFRVWKRIKDLISYRKLITSFDSRFPDATPEELQRYETCIFCLNEMEEGKKLPCGHIFHAACLRRFLETGVECPICREDISAASHNHSHVHSTDIPSPAENEQVPPEPIPYETLTNMMNLMLQSNENQQINLQSLNDHPHEQSQTKEPNVSDNSHPVIPPTISSVHQSVKKEETRRDESKPTGTLHIKNEHTSGNSKSLLQKNKELVQLYRNHVYNLKKEIDEFEKSLEELIQ